MFELTAEQEEIRRVCRDFAAREIRPAAAAVDAAEAGVPMDLWHKAAGIGLTGVHAPRVARRRRDDRRADRLPGAGGALPRLRRDRQPDHLQRLLRRARADARDRGAAGALAAPADRRPAPADRARHHRARRRLGRRRDAHPRPQGRRRLRARRPEGVDLQRRDRAVLRRLRHGRAGHRPPRHHGVPARPRRRGALVRRADPEDGPAGDPEHRALPRRTASSPTTAGSAPRARASAG